MVGKRQKIVCSFGTWQALCNFFWASVATQLAARKAVPKTLTTFYHTPTFISSCGCVRMCVFECELRQVLVHLFLQLFARFTICILSCFELHFYVCIVRSEKSVKLRKTHIVFHKSHVTLCRADECEK